MKLHLHKTLPLFISALSFTHVRVFSSGAFGSLLLRADLSVNVEPESKVLKEYKVVKANRDQPAFTLVSLRDLWPNGLFS
jgi:hypothetical protein